MTRIACLHLGLPKTGTTTIQGSLFAARERLAGAGVLYPGFAENHSTALRSAFGASPHVLAPNRMRGAGTPAAGRAVAAEWAAALDAALAAPGWRRVVLSAEGASHLREAGFTALRARLLAHVDAVEVIVVLREPMAWRVSLVQQALKTGGRIGAEVARLAVPGIWRETLARIGGVFGADAVRVLVMEEMAAGPGGLVGGFAAAAGIAPELVGAAPERNAAMSLRASLVMDRMNAEVPLFVGGRVNRGRSRWADRLVRRLPGPPFALTPEQGAALAAAVAEDRVFAAETLGRMPWGEARVRVGAPMAVDALVAGAKLLGRVLP